MRAKLLPLKGKYYGTEIEIEYKGEVIKISLWKTKGKPSERELQKSGYTKKQWDDNVHVDDGWGGKTSIRNIVTCDTHHESQYTYELAQEIVSRLTDDQEDKTQPDKNVDNCK
jgi:hypothetical protein